MKKDNLITVCLLLFSVSLLSSPASALPQASWWGLSTGQINVFRNRDLKNTVFGMEVRFPPLTRWQLTPSAGFQWTNAGFNYLYTDMKYLLTESPHWKLNIYSGIGLYEESNLIDLGHTIEFRSGIELGYALDSRRMIALNISHYSNSRLAKVNPGTEAMTLIYLQQF